MAGTAEGRRYARADGRARPEAGSRGSYGKTVRPVGAEYVGKDGFVMVKTALWPNEPGSKGNWVPKHRAVWERANGRALPKGWVVMFCDGDNRNFDPANLCALPRSTMQRMNWMKGTGRVPAWTDRATFDAARLIAEVEVAAYRRESYAPRRCGVCGREFVPDKGGRSGSSVNLRTCRECLGAGRKASHPRSRGAAE